jgi:hypothetical protein
MTKISKAKLAAAAKTNLLTLAQKERNKVIRRAKELADKSGEIQLVDELTTGTGLQFVYSHIASIRIGDGDTLKANIDLGFNQFTVQKLRYARVDLPESSTSAGAYCTTLQQYLFSKFYIVDMTTKSQDKFGRWLTEFNLKDIGSLNSALLDFKIGKPYRGGKRSFNEEELSASIAGVNSFMESVRAYL